MREAVRDRFAAGARDRSGRRSAEEVADGFIRSRSPNMANAIKKISVQRGYDVTRYTLQCFGGAGGQHACLVADALGMTEVLLHPLAGVLSAYGMGLADIRATRQQALEEPLGDAAARAAIAKRGEGACRRGACRRGRRPGRCRRRRSHGAARPYPLRRHRHGAGPSRRRFPENGRWNACAPKSAFEAAQARFGFIDRGKELVIEAVSVEAIGGGARRRAKRRSLRAKPLARSAARASFTAARHEAAVYTRDQLAPARP
jgi:5-oxoprolinase (ATP-hydrolysing)